MSPYSLVLIFIVISGTSLSCWGRKKQVEIGGKLKKWHKITLTFTGPSSSETANPNPFTEYVLDVTFKKKNKIYKVPGYFAADGNAAQTSAQRGNKWRVHFSPDKIGRWHYAVSFRLRGKGVSFDGTKGSFVVRRSTAKGSRDHRRKGRLRYVGKHHLQFEETREYFLKQGTDSPENFLAYADFDGTPNNSDLRKTWSAHVRDWRRGDPTWKGNKGKGIIGAINYLSSKGMNAISFLTMNIQGDDKNVFPYINDNDFTRFDCSKLDQWEIVFSHFDKMGIYLHFKMTEWENWMILDGDSFFGENRKLYYREIIARFSHHLALNWNIGEENGNTSQQQKAFASFLHRIDPYNHPVVVHNRPNLADEIYTPLLGPRSLIAGTSMQISVNGFTSEVFSSVKKWVDKSAKSRKKWVVAVDEHGGPVAGIKPDKDSDNSHHTNARQNALWGPIMAGGAGCEYFFGMLYDDSDLTCQNFRSRDRWFDYCRHAIQFFETNKIPFWEMSSRNGLVSNKKTWCLSDRTHYVIYLPGGETTNLDLRKMRKNFVRVEWYDPRNGGKLQNSSVKSIKGRRKMFDLGPPPRNIHQDWVVYVKGVGVLKRKS